MSSDGNVCASISHDENVKFWNVENIKDIKIDAQSKSENKKLKNSKERRNSTMNKKAIHNEFEFYANDDIQNQIEQLVIMESKKINY